MNYMLDTNAYSDMGRHGQWINLISRAEKVYLPVTVIGELKEGFLGGRRQVENERILNEFMKQSPVHVCEISSITAVHYANLKHYLKNNGTPIPTNDIWIAASALEHQTTLLTRDTHFSKLPQVSVMLAE